MLQIGMWDIWWICGPPRLLVGRFHRHSTRRGDQAIEGGEEEEAMTSTRKFCCDDLFRFNNVNLDVLTETVGDLRWC